MSSKKWKTKINSRKLLHYLMESLNLLNSKWKNSVLPMVEIIKFGLYYFLLKIKRRAPFNPWIILRLRILDKFLTKRRHLSIMLLIFLVSLQRKLIQARTKIKD